MELKITWVNYNSSIDGIRLYRAESPIEEDALPEVLTELPPEATEYHDGTVEQGKMYYYRVCFYRGNDTAFGKNIPVRAIGYNGPGPQEIFSGDWDMGYFGVLSGDEFMYYSELHQRFELSGIPVTMSNNWAKLAYRGKVIYVPLMQVSLRVSYRELYDKGLVYGTDDFGKVIPNGSVGVNQYTATNIQGSDFIVRLPQCLPDVWENGTSFMGNRNGTMVGNPGENEWDDITRALFGADRWMGENNKGEGRIANFSSEFTYVDQSGKAYSLCLGQQSPPMNTNNVVIRGSGYYLNNYTSLIPVSITTMYVADTERVIYYTDNNSTTSYGTVVCWRPFLELVI